MTSDGDAKLSPRCRVMPIMSGDWRMSRTRGIARAMLFAWLFAIGTAWAQACVVQPARLSDVALHHDASVAIDGDEHVVIVSQQACLSFCDTAQGGVAKTALHDLATILPPSVASAALAPPWPGERRWRGVAAPPPPRVPLAIAFLRLTI